MTSIDVVIPSYRLNEQYLLPIIQMEIPEGVAVRYLIIADNPEMEPPAKLMEFVDGENVILIRNKTNLGASESRNVGIENSNADWILFLDDDVAPEKNLLQVYRDEIRESPDETGFFGLTRFPRPFNSFTRGLVVADMLYFFYFARHNQRGRCATTSNVLVRKSAIGDTRFSQAFPKKGGGEDFAFFLEIFQNSQQTLKCVEKAVVHHPWWHDGRRNYTQFMRWSYGDFELFRLFPQVTYYDFPNMVESLAIFIPLSILTSVLIGSILPLLCVVLGILLGEVFVEVVQITRNKGIANARYALEMILVRSSADLGRFYGQLMNGRLKDMLRRPNYSIHKVNIYFRLWTGLKFMAYTFFAVALYLLFSNL